MQQAVARVREWRDGIKGKGRDGSTNMERMGKKVGGPRKGKEELQTMHKNILQWHCTFSAKNIS